MIVLKKINPIVLLLIVLNVFPVVLQGQSVGFSGRDFPHDTRGVRAARKHFKQGEKLYFKGGGLNQAALNHLLKAHAYNPNNARLNYMIGDIYLQTTEHPRAVLFLEKAIALGTPMLQAHYLLARAYQMDYRFEEAIGEYHVFRSLLPAEDLLQFNPGIDRGIEECNNAMALIDNPGRVFIDNAGFEVNSPYDDYGPLPDPHGNTLYFTSRRPLSSNTGMDPRDHKYYENIFQAHLKEEGWHTAGLVEGKINSRSHDATAALSAGGELMIVYRGKKGGNLYESRLEQGKWSKPERLFRKSSKKHQQTSAALSSDGNTLYFISDRPGGYGAKDIWVSRRNSRDRWDTPVNLGPGVNTPYDEEGLFLAPDDITLYFSSRGHNSMGGFDVFKTTMTDGGWSAPQNMGYPINSPGDDLFFVLAPGGNTAWFASIRPEGMGGSDIYTATFLGPEKPVVYQRVDELTASRARPMAETFLDQTTTPIPPMTVLRGRVIDDETMDPLQATIELYDNEEELLLAQFQANPETGDYFISLPGGKNYGISVQAEGYLFHSENINVVQTDIHREIVIDIRLKKIEVGQTIVLNNIFFDSGQSSLRAESYAELGVLYKLLVDNQNLKIKISGHTDNIGSATLNQRLSEARARAVVEFLVGRGINPGRLAYQGYGFTRPVATNDTAEGRQQNRRTEFEILEK